MRVLNWKEVVDRPEVQTAIFRGETWVIGPLDDNDHSIRIITPENIILNIRFDGYDEAKTFVWWLINRKVAIDA
jgi:hypothetical protein